MARAPHWTYEQTLIAFRVYLNTDFGKLNQSNSEIAEIAAMIGRSPSALAMKCCNFASLDPDHTKRGVKGLTNRSHIEEQVWEDYQRNCDKVTAQMEFEWDRLIGHAAEDLPEDDATYVIAGGPSDVERVIRTRRLQGVFRKAVLVGYRHRCALTGLGIPALLNASHIIPWSQSESRRADPRNGLCLNVLHDRAFDRGLLTFDEDFRAVVSAQMQEDAKLGHLTSQLKAIEGKKLTMPDRFGPSPEAMMYHRDHVFCKQ